MSSLTARQHAIIALIEQRQPLAVSLIQAGLSEQVSIPTINRDLAHLVQLQLLERTGKGRSTAYRIAPGFRFNMPFDALAYFDKEPERRNAKTLFDTELIDLLEHCGLLEADEIQQLEGWRVRYRHNIATLSPTIYKKELERLTIELSWKSAEIEGNTYSLLETELLFKERREAQGKPKEDAAMLLNHKDALDYLLQYPDSGSHVSIALLEEIHSLLMKDLGVERNIRSRTVGITGSAYRPLDNSHQIRDALQAMCELINAKKNAFEKALLAVLLISYIQPFEDGNKRTARMISNALLLADHACPLSYRNIDALDYKKAMLLFYEQHNTRAFKQIFMEQNRFSAEHYFC